MNLLTLLVAVGSLPVGLLILDICIKAFRKKERFLMHTMKNAPSSSNRIPTLEEYDKYIRNPSVISYVQNIKGWICDHD